MAPKDDSPGNPEPTVPVAPTSEVNPEPTVPPVEIPPFEIVTYSEPDCAPTIDINIEIKSD